MSLQSVAPWPGWLRLRHWSNPLNYLRVQVCLSCCTLKCKITISEIENGWLSTVAAPAVPCCRRVGDGWGSAAAGSDQAGATGGWAGLWREEMPGAGSSIHLVDLQMGGQSSSSSPDGWSVAISILASRHSNQIGSKSQYSNLQFPTQHWLLPNYSQPR